MNYDCQFYMLPRSQNEVVCILNVELLLCVAKWINQSKQTTGRRQGSSSMFGAENQRQNLLSYYIYVFFPISGSPSLHLSLDSIDVTDLIHSHFYLYVYL